MRSSDQASDPSAPDSTAPSPNSTAPSPGSTDPATSTSDLGVTDLLNAAVERTGKVQTVTSEYRSPKGPTVRVIRSVSQGQDEHRTIRWETPDGQPLPARTPQSIVDEVSIGNRSWSTDASGQLTEATSFPEDRLAAYSVSVPFLLRAIGLDSTVEELGPDEVQGRQARHLRVELGPRSIAALESRPANQLAAFELEYPGQPGLKLEIWIADGLLVRTRVVPGYSEETVEGPVVPVEVTVDFFDFDEPVSITPPT